MAPSRLCGMGSLGRPFSADARPAFAAAECADAAFYPERICSHDRDVACIARAVVGVVDLARPFSGTGWLHAAEQRQADHGTLFKRRIGVLVIDRGFAGGG